MEQRTPKVDEDAEVKDVDRYFAYEDLSEYEKEKADDWITPPPIQKPNDKLAGKTRPPKHKKLSKAVSEQYTDDIHKILETPSLVPRPSTCPF